MAAQVGVAEGLVVGTNYRFYLVASNAYGDSD